MSGFWLRRYSDSCITTFAPHSFDLSFSDMYWPIRQLIIKDSSLTVLDARERWNSIYYCPLNHKKASPTS